MTLTIRNNANKCNSPADAALHEGSAARTHVRLIFQRILKLTELGLFSSNTNLSRIWSLRRIITTQKSLYGGVTILPPTMISQSL